MRKTIIGAITVIALVLSACGDRKDNNQAAPAATEVSVYMAKPEALTPVTEYTTRIMAFEDAAIVARVSARVLERNVHGGQEVSKGDVLITLDPIDTELAAQQAAATVEIAKANLGEAERNYARGKTLEETGAIAAIEMDGLVTRLEAARANLKSAEATLAIAEVNLGYTRVTAPLDGIVGLVNVSVGDLIGPQSGPVLTITRQDTVLVDIEVSEADILTYTQRAIAGEDLEFNMPMRLPNNSIYDAGGSLFSVANSANPATGTMTVRIAYPNPDGLLTPGQSATVLVSEADDSGRMAVPQAAVQHDQRGSYVMVVAEDMTVSAKYLSVGTQVGEWWLVNDGLEPGDIVVTTGLQKIRPGSLVSYSR